MRRAVAAAGLTALFLTALFLAGCGGPAPSPSTSATATASADGAAGFEVVEPGAIRYTCGRFPFGAEILTVVRHDETGPGPLAAALRLHVARNDMDINWLPDTGWTLVGQDAQGAEFVTATGEGLMVAAVGRVIGEPQVPFAVDGWVVDGWGGCNPQRMLAPGLGAAEWSVAPGQAIGPGTTRFDALVTELACASGQSSEGRIVGPDIVVAEDQVLVTFAVRPQGGTEGQTCQGNPSTRVTVTLPEPLGGRALLDGSTLPPRQPVARF